MERPVACLPNAGTLLECIDEILEAVEARGDFIDRTNFDTADRRCVACGLGFYQDMGLAFDKTMGLARTTEAHFKVFLCQRCGNAQIFGQTQDIPDWR